MTMNVLTIFNNVIGIGDTMTLNIHGALKKQKGREKNFFKKRVESTLKSKLSLT